MVSHTFSRGGVESAKPHELSGGVSMLLDVVRFAAALGVLAAHAGEPTFGTGWAHHQAWGDMAVPVFFVLSGFIIRFVTRTREGDPREYYIDRASRIYSVVIPGMLVTLACSLACLLLHRERFLHDWAQVFNHPVGRLLGNIFFTSQIWGHTTLPFINAPFWSLGFECPYYVFYGFVFFLRGWKRVAACVLLAAIVGPQILFLLPVWWMGVWLYDVYYRFRSRPASLVAIVVLPVWLLLTLLSGLGVRVLRPVAIPTLFAYIASRPNLLEVAGLAVHHCRMFVYAAGVLSGLLLLLSLLVIDALPMPAMERLRVMIRRVADGTFILYLFHYPLLLLASYLGLFRYGHNFSNFLVVGGIVVLSVVLAGPLDGLKRAIRRGLRGVVPAKVAVGVRPFGGALEEQTDATARATA